MVLNIRRCRWLPFILIAYAISVFAAAEQTVTVTFDRKADLSINNTSVDLGTIQGTVGTQYYERINAVRVSFHCNAKTNWEVRASGTNFTSGANTIPITQLSWKKASTNYSAFSGAGNYTVIANPNNYPGHSANWHDEDISYRLNVTGDELEGTYQATITYTLFVP